MKLSFFRKELLPFFYYYLISVYFHVFFQSHTKRLSFDLRFFHSFFGTCFRILNWLMGLDIKSVYTLLTDSLTYSMEQGPSWGVNRFSASQEFPHTYGNWPFITAFTRARHLSLSWARSIQSVPQIPLTEIHVSINLPSKPGSSKSSFFLKFPHQKPVCTSPLPIRATCHAHLILLDLISRKTFREEYRSWSSSLCSFIHSPFTSSLLGPNILLNTLFSNTLTLRTSLNVCDQVSHPHKTIGQIIDPCTLIFIHYILYILYFWIANRMTASIPWLQY